tara:strand:- start:1300 stop:1761 length:462 start_codon:yes stop_codon:yes gene_type:complete
MSEHPSQLTTPKVAALAITYKEDQLLLIQRSKEPQKYGWGFPGGSVHPGEALNDAACRELYEETQVQSLPEHTFGVIEVNEFDRNGQHHHYILVPVLCRYVSGIAKASDDAMDCRWVSIQDILADHSRFIDHVHNLTQQVVTLMPELLKRQTS